MTPEDVAKFAALAGSSIPLNGATIVEAYLTEPERPMRFQFEMFVGKDPKRISKRKAARKARRKNRK